MDIGIIGSGKMGTGLGRLWAKHGHHVMFSYSRRPEKLENLVLEIGSHARSGTPRHAVGFANVLFLAVRWEEVKDALSAAGVMNGKTLISCLNPFGPRGLEVGLNTSAAEEISSLVPDAAVVEAFNTIFATILHSRAHLFGNKHADGLLLRRRSRRKEPCRRTYPGCRPSAGRRRRSGKCPVRRAPCDADDGTRP